MCTHELFLLSCTCKYMRKIISQYNWIIYLYHHDVNRDLGWAYMCDLFRADIYTPYINFFHGRLIITITELFCDVNLKDKYPATPGHATKYYNTIADNENLCIQDVIALAEPQKSGEGCNRDYNIRLLDMNDAEFSVRNIAPIVHYGWISQENASRSQYIFGEIITFVFKDVAYVFQVAYICARGAMYIYPVQFDAFSYTRWLNFDCADLGGAASVCDLYEFLLFEVGVNKYMYITKDKFSYTTLCCAITIKIDQVVISYCKREGLRHRCIIIRDSNYAYLLNHGRKKMTTVPMCTTRKYIEKLHCDLSYDIFI